MPAPLLARVQSVSDILPELRLAMPPPPRPTNTKAESVVTLLPERVQASTNADPPWFAMPPPKSSAWLPERVQLVSDSVPLELQMPPPSLTALLPVRMLPVSDSVPVEL